MKNEWHVRSGERFGLPGRWVLVTRRGSRIVLSPVSFGKQEDAQTFAAMMGNTVPVSVNGNALLLLRTYGAVRVKEDAAEVEQQAKASGLRVKSYAAHTAKGTVLYLERQ